MRMLAPGHIAFALALAGLGILSLIYGDFALQWQPVPQWVPWREGLAYISGAILFLGGLGLLFKRVAARCAFVLTVYLLICWVLPQTSRVVSAPSSVGRWLGLCETLAALSGGWILWTSLKRQDSTPSVDLLLWASTLAASAWMVASSLRRRPWVEPFRLFRRP
jgi:uncharacterized membrane protein